MTNAALSPDTPWRRVASVLYSRPRDSKIFGSVDLDVTALEAYVAEKRNTGLRVTLTHVILLAFARGISEKVPEFNTFVRRGRILARPRLDASLSVLIRDRDEMSNVKVPAVDTLTLEELSIYVAGQVLATQQGEEAAALHLKHRLAALPWPLRGWLVRLVAWLTLDLGLDLSGLGLHNDRFGCFLLSNIGSIGLDLGYPALFPGSNLSLVVTMGAVNTKPAYLDGVLQPRRVLTLSAAMDHRLVDGLHGGRLFQYLKKVAAEPSLLDRPPVQRGM